MAKTEDAQYWCQTAHADFSGLLWRVVSDSCLSGFLQCFNLATFYCQTSNLFLHFHLHLSFRIDTLAISILLTKPTLSNFNIFSLVPLIFGPILLTTFLSTAPTAILFPSPAAVYNSHRVPLLGGVQPIRRQSIGHNRASCHNARTTLQSIHQLWRMLMSPGLLIPYPIAAVVLWSLGLFLPAALVRGTHQGPSVGADYIVIWERNFPPFPSSLYNCQHYPVLIKLIPAP